MLSVEQGNLLQYNLFGYGFNNPIMNFDPTGYNAAQIAMLKFVSIYGLGLSGWLLSVKLGAFLSAVFPYLVPLIAGVITGYLVYVGVQIALANKQVNDAATKVGLNQSQRQILRRVVENYKSGQGRKPNDNLPWGTLLDLARQVKQGRYK